MSGIELEDIWTKLAKIKRTQLLEEVIQNQILLLISKLQKMEKDNLTEFLVWTTLKEIVQVRINLLKN